MSTDNIDIEKLTRLAEKHRRSHIAQDYANFYRPTDDIFGDATGTDDNGRPSVGDLQMVTQRRLGLAWRATRIPARDAIRNDFHWEDEAGHEQERPEIFRFMIETDLKNQMESWVYYALCFGTGFLMKYWGSDDAFDEPPPDEIPPKRFKAFSPAFLQPQNVFESRGIDYDEEIWHFIGGSLNPTRIHRDRVEVFSPFPVEGHWRGIAALEPCWYSLMCYYQLIIHATRGVAKWGNIVAALKMGNNQAGKKEFEAWLELMEEFRANDFWLIGREDELQFLNAKVGQGISEIAEFLKEDIAAATGIPLNQLFGRAVSGGIGGEGALTSERNYMHHLANIQMSVNDDLIRVLDMAGFDVEGVRPVWNLSLQKTHQQKLVERQLEIQTEMMEMQLEAMQENVEQMEIQTSMLRTQEEIFARSPDQIMEHAPERVASNEGGNEQDFLPPSRDDWRALRERNEEILAQNRAILQAIQDTMKLGVGNQ